MFQLQDSVLYCLDEVQVLCLASSSTGYTKPECSSSSNHNQSWVPDTPFIIPPAIKSSDFFHNAHHCISATRCPCPWMPDTNKSSHKAGRKLHAATAGVSYTPWHRVYSGCSTTMATVLKAPKCWDLFGPREPAFDEAVYATGGEHASRPRNFNIACDCETFFFIFTTSWLLPFDSQILGRKAGVSTNEGRRSKLRHK